jgi:hypothetical protein
MNCKNSKEKKNSDCKILEIDIKNFKIIKIKNNYKILYNDNNIIIDLKNIKFPFGIEKYNNVYYINVEINNPLIIEYIQLFEKNIEIIVKQDENYKDYTFISNIKQRDNFLPLLKTRIINKNNKFICNSNISLFDIISSKYYNIDLIIDFIWFYNNKTFGIFWKLHTIY